MMIKRKYLVFAALFLFVWACEEIGPDIDLNPIIVEQGDTTFITTPVPAAQSRQVLLEEFTGVRCTNCVAGHIKLDELLLKFPQNLVAVSIHATFFANPVPGLSKYDFRTTEAELLATDLGVISLPAGVVNRTIHPGEADMAIPISKWETYIDQTKDEAPDVNLELLVKDYNDADSSFTLQVTSTFIKEKMGTVHITVMLTENDIIDLQLGPKTMSNPSGELPNYKHKHLMRRVVTPASGSALVAPDFQPGRVIVRNFSIKLGSGWVPENCYAIAFVHEVGSSKKVLQSAEVHVK